MGSSAATNIKRVFVYTDAAPVDRDVVAHGLHRAASPILRSIIDHVDGIAIYPIGTRYHARELAPDLAPLCSTLPWLPTLLSKALRYYPALDFGVADSLPVLMLSPGLRRSSADILFAFVGADAGALARAAKLASVSGKSYAFYVVDDFIAALRLAGAKQDRVQKAEERAREALRDAKQVFVITDGLGEQLHTRYGIETTTLRLAFEPEPRPILPSKLQIIYVGSINFLYLDGLRDLFKVVERVRKVSDVDLTVRLTAPVEVAERELGELPHFVTSAPVETSDGLAQEISSSLFAFLPYSFGLQQKAMVTTSFPSKSLEYLAYARSIIVYGPEYGVATKLFREMELPSVVSSLGELEKATRCHLATSPEHSVVYRRYLAEAHSLAAVRKKLCSGLGLE